MKLYELSRLATRDLDGIADYSTAQWEVRRSKAYINHLRSTMERLGARPALGRKRDQIKPGYRQFAVPRKLFFYWILPGVVRVERVLHGSMDVTQNL